MFYYVMFPLLGAHGVLVHPATLPPWRGGPCGASFNWASCTDALGVGLGVGLQLAVLVPVLL